MTDPNSRMRFSDDSSLQRWGANLTGADEAAQEVEKAFRAAEERASAILSAFARIAQQGETDLPTSRRLMADIEAIRDRMKSATTAREWRSVAAELASLPRTFNVEHETDIERVQNPRGGSHLVESRADVSKAAQDN